MNPSDKVSTRRIILLAVQRYWIVPSVPRNVAERELYHQQLREWEPVTEVHPHRHIRLDTAGSALEKIRWLLLQLYAITL